MDQEFECPHCGEEAVDPADHECPELRRNKILLEAGMKPRLIAKRQGPKPDCEVCPVRVFCCEKFRPVGCVYR